MPGFDGTGPMGLGSMTGGGRGFCSPWGIGATLRARGIPSGVGYGFPYRGVGPFVPGAMPFIPQMTREQELEFLKTEAQALRGQLKEIEASIQELSAKKE